MPVKYEVRNPANKADLENFLKEVRDQRWKVDLVEQSLKTGRPIEVRDKVRDNGVSITWRKLAATSTFLKGQNCYRLAPIPRYVPYTLETFLADLNTKKAVIHNPSNSLSLNVYRTILGFSPNGVMVFSYNATTVVTTIPWDGLLAYHRWSDGSPCGTIANSIYPDDRPEPEDDTIEDQDG